MAYKSLVIDASLCPGTNLWRASDDDRSVATMHIVSLEYPAKVEPGEVFQIKCTYQFGEKLYRNTTSDGLNPTPLENWPEYHGAHRRCISGLPGLCSQHQYWIWRFLNMKLYRDGAIVATHTDATLSPGQKLTYTWTGTIEELTGQEFPESTIVSGGFSLSGYIYGWYGSELWPWGWPLSQNWLQERPTDSAGYTIEVEVYVTPPPPYPLFNTDYCSVSKQSVAPNEQFNINIRIENQSEGGGPYSIGCFCEGKYLELGTGTIAGGGIVNRTFPVTANQLTQKQITSPQWLSFSIAVNNEEGETDKWTPAAIYVSGPDNGDTATLTGRVTDKETGQGIGGVLVTTTGVSASTSATGYYTLDDLTPGYYSIKFSKSGYHDVTKTKTLVAGANTLNVTMTPDTEPEPGEVPWKLIAAGAAVVGAALILPPLIRNASRRKDKT